MKLKNVLFGTFLLLLFSFSTFGQNVNGVVVDNDTGEPLIAATVRNLTTNAGVSTDIDGSFSLQANTGDLLSISYIGYISKEVTVGTDDLSAIGLLLDSDSLEEVIVIGYGQVKKSEVTGAVSYVDSETINDIKPINAQEALQGTTPGVSVTPQSGSPGSGFNIRIRGVGTNGNASPLVIIDGYQGDINLLNPDDIDSFVILKDAQAAIYGAQGANGVILVTTKSGKKNQKATVSVDSYYGIQNTEKKISLLNRLEYATLLNEAYAANGQDVPFADIRSAPFGSDWQEELFETNSPMHSNSVNVVGGGERVTYSLGGSFLSQDGIIGSDKSNFYRGTGRAGVNIDISDKLKFSTNNIYTSLNRRSINDFALGSVLFNALNAPPTLSARNDNGDFSLIPSTTGLGIEIINPLAQIDNTYNDYFLRKLNGNFRLDYELLDGLTVTGRFGYNTTTSESKNFNKIVDYGGKVFDVQRSSVNQNAINDNDYTLDFFANYNKQFGQKHNLDATIASSYYKQYGNGLFATGYDVPDNSFQFADIALATGTSDGRDVGSYAYDERIGSYTSRIQYNYNEKYFVTGILRRDRSTKFGQNNQVGWFPSATAGWTVSEESFFENNVIDLLKLRASYGELGNDRIESNLFTGTLSPTGGVYVFNGQIVQASAPGTLPNPDVKWEASQKFDVGFDMDLLDNKITFVADYFRNTRNDLLLSNTPVSGITGTSAPGSGNPTVNVGGVRNTGFEFALNYKGEVGTDFNYSLGYNLGTIDNVVTNVAGEGTFIEGGGFGVGNPAPARMEVGMPIGYYLGYETAGIFQNQAEVNAHATQNVGGSSAQPGDLIYVDTNGDGEITLADRVELGSPIAEMNMGFNLQADYKGFDFLVYTYASLGHEMVRNYERTLSDVNQLNYKLDRWTGEGTSNTVPRVTAGASGNNVFSDFYVEDASFARIQTAQIGYNLPTAFSNSINMSSARVYLKGNNLYTFTDYLGFDPSASNGAPIGSGFDQGFYPQARIFILGANLKF